MLVGLWAVCAVHASSLHTSSGKALLQFRGGTVSGFAGKLAKPWAGGLADLTVAAAVGGVAGQFVGSSIDTHKLYSQVAVTMFLHKIGLVTIQWSRVRQLARCMIGLPLRAVRTQKRRRKAAELQRTSEAGSTDDDEEKLWVGFNEYAVVGGLAAFCVSAYCTPTGGGWKRLRGGSSFVPIEARRRDTTVKAVTQRPTRTPSVTMSDEADDESDTAPVNAAEALQDRLDKTGLVPTEPQGFDGDGFGGYLLPYAGGLILTLLLTSAAFSALVLGSGSAPK